jgi:phage regulator Rha-like protein
MTALDIFAYADTLVISSETVAEGSGVQHKNVLELIYGNLSDFEDFGQVAFQTRRGYNNAQVRVALLNEQQATLLMTFQRNTDQVRKFKKDLVRAFFEMARATPAPAAELTRLEILTLALESETRAIAAESKVAELEPSATAWVELASATGDYEVADAAKVLARAGVLTGRQRLFEQLRTIGWIHRGAQGKWTAYQTAVDNGYLTEKPMSHHHPRTGEVVLDPPQVRVTVKGLDRLRIRLGTLDLQATG